jgi:RHS repeat-associated protein
MRREIYFLKINTITKTNIMIKNISQYAVVLLFFTATAINAQTPLSIAKPEKPATSYNVTATTVPMTLIAGETITFGPGTFIQAGSTFTARISSLAQDIAIPVVPSIAKNDNYIYSRIFQTPMTTVNGIKNNRDVQESITYFDGLGRPVQKNAIRQGGDVSDIITHIEYDGFGRQVKDYLPFSVANTDNNYSKMSAQDALNNTLSFYDKEYYDKTVNPFSEKKFEPSPLNRITEQAAPGNDWAMSNAKKNTIKLEYQTNTSGDAVKLYKAVTSWQTSKGLYDISLSAIGNYDQYELYKNVSYDENSGVNPSESSGSIIEFKNKEGQIVLKRTYNAGLKHDTYYVYDIYGDLTYVLPPKADSTINDEVLNGLCYQYKYDNKKRLVEKKLPGKQWEFIVYDKLDRPVATGPSFSPFQNDAAIGWLITKYDVFGRPVYTGWSAQSVNTTTRNTMQTAQNTAKVLFETKQTSGTIDGIAAYYTNDIEPKIFKILTVNYYDDYTFPGAQAIPATIIGQKVLTSAKSLATGSWTRALTTILSTAGETTTVFYDTKGRAISNYVKNYLTGISHTDNEIDFTGKTLSSITEHQKGSGGTKITIKEKFTYTAQNRLLTHTHQIGAEAEQLLTDNTYDALGQLTGKNVGNSTGSPLQKIGYNYNIRGWLTQINKTDNLQQGSDPKDLFAFKINYTKTEGNSAVTKALFNGNIAETFWATNSDGGKLRGYGYQYDQLNRLKNATYQTPKLVDNKNYFGENMDYDKNGNITKLQRKFMAGTLTNPYADDMDDLGYFYKNNSNQLIKVTDATNSPQGFKSANKTGDDYSYDDNGNLTKDQNKKIIEIAYNHLNLTKKITFGDGNTIEYIYDATGAKLEKNVTENKVLTNTKYLSGFQYKNDVLQFFPTAEGYVRNTSTNPATYVFGYVYNYTDHLGNVRLSYAQNAKKTGLEILEENNYYPFGLKHAGYNTDDLQPGYKYKYNGKEFQDELDLNMHDYGARSYDPALGRWVVMDGKGELYFGSSSYVYASNTPIQAIDPDGNLVIFINGMHGGSGGTPDYWRNYTGRESNFMSMSNREAFDISVMNQLGDNSAKYVDGAMGGITGIFTAFGLAGGNSDALTRVRAGESQGKADAKSIINNLARDKTTGEIVETIKIITHSMGGAYGKGYVKALKQYIKTLPKEQQYQIKISMVVDYDPYQGASLRADGEIPTWQKKHVGSGNVLGLGWLANENQEGKVETTTNTDNSTDHSIMSFMNDIKNLSEGTYKWDSSQKQWLKQ